MLHQNHIYALSLANKGLHGRQSKALDKFVNSAPQILFLSRHFSHFSTITSKQDWAL